MLVTYNSGMVGKILNIGRKGLYVTVSVVLALGLTGVVYPRHAAAERLQNRSLTLSDVMPGAVVSHDFKFTYTTTGADVASVVFQYCTSPIPELACDAPAGMDATGAVMDLQTGEIGYAISNAQPNSITISRTATAPSGAPAGYTFSNIKNPTVNGTFFVRISTHTAADGSDAAIDFGGVANSISSGVTVNSEVPPYLKFCVGLTITGDCSTADGNLVDMGTMVPSKASSGSSQMMAATNGEFGLVIAAYGTTMTSGTNVLPPLTAPTVSAPGNSQFGLNLRDNSDPDIGSDPSGAGVATPAANYNIPNRYTFINGDTVASSGAVTDTRKFTVSYLANVSPSQAPGVYTATLTYICTATF